MVHETRMCHEEQIFYSLLSFSHFNLMSYSVIDSVVLFIILFKSSIYTTCQELKRFFKPLLVFSIRML
jgi:hypothetical protein